MDENGVNLTENFAHYGILDLAMFLISPQPKIKSTAFAETAPSKIQLLVNLQNLEEQEAIDLNFTADPAKYSQGYQLLGDPETIRVVFSGGITEAEIKSAEGKGETISNISTYGAATMETSSVALSFFLFDSSGSLMKMSQMSKIYCRFKFFDINFGSVLGTYFDFSSKKFDPPSKEPMSYIVDHSNKYYGNLLLKKVALDIFEVNPLRITIYGVSWLLKTIFTILLIVAKSREYIPKAQAYLTSISQKVHMIALNSIAIDLIPYTLITLFHARRLSFFTTWLSGALLILLLLDYAEILIKGGKSKIFEFKP